MEVQAKRSLLERFLAERSSSMPRKGAIFLELVLQSDALCTMHFCRPRDRAKLRDSILIATTGVSVWGVLLGNDSGGGPERRVRLCLDLLDLTPAQVLERLQSLPVWFLCIDEAYTPAEEHRPPDVEATVMAPAPWHRLRRLALLDQLDAALDEGDWAIAGKLRSLLYG